MTGYQTAITPLHIPSTPHLGLPVINPLLAPIAGDVAAQGIYKAPFAVAIVCVWQTVIAPGRYRRGVS